MLIIEQNGLEAAQDFGYVDDFERRKHGIKADLTLLPRDSPHPLVINEEVFKVTVRRKRDVYGILYKVDMPFPPFTKLPNQPLIIAVAVGPKEQEPRKLVEMINEALAPKELEKHYAELLESSPNPEVREVVANNRRSFEGMLSKESLYKQLSEAIHDYELAQKLKKGMR